MNLNGDDSLTDVLGVTATTGASKSEIKNVIY